MNRQEPLVKRDLGVFKDCANRDSELLAASAALPKALASGPRAAFLSDDAIATALLFAVWASGDAIGPALRFEEVSRGVGVGEVRRIGDAELGAAGLRHESIVPSSRGFVKYIIRNIFALFCWGWWWLGGGRCWSAWLGVQ